MLLIEILKLFTSLNFFSYLCSKSFFELLLESLRFSISNGADRHNFNVGVVIYWN